MPYYTVQILRRVGGLCPRSAKKSEISGKIKEPFLYGSFVISVLVYIITPHAHTKELVILFQRIQAGIFCAATVFLLYNKAKTIT